MNKGAKSGLVVRSCFSSSGSGRPLETFEYVVLGNLRIIVAQNGGGPVSVEVSTTNGAGIVVSPRSGNVVWIAEDTR